MAETAARTSNKNFPDPPGMRVESRIGAGARSVWCQAMQIRLDRRVALKYLRPELAGVRTFRTVFLEAGRQAAAIVHPAALPIINVFPKEQCIAMQLCRGEPMRSLAGALPPHTVAAVGMAVMDCLSSLHATGRCHGNLLPGNIFADREGGVWVDDFFQPPVMFEGRRNFVTEEEYISPLTRASGICDWSSDVFSLGRILARSLDPDNRSDELAILLEAMQSMDMTKRIGSPQAVLEAFKRVHRLEEVRRGRDSATTLRKKRMYRRIPAEFKVSLRRRSATPVETAAILMKTRDIGESGVFVETDDALIGVGSIVELDIALKGAEGNVHAFGIVRWKSRPPMATGVGVQFVEVDQAGLARLREFMEKRR